MMQKHFAMDGLVQANTAEPALPGRRCCRLEGEATEGRFGGEI